MSTCSCPKSRKHSTSKIINKILNNECEVSLFDHCLKLSSLHKQVSGVSLYRSLLLSYVESGHCTGIGDVGWVCHPSMYPRQAHSAWPSLCGLMQCVLAMVSATVEEEMSNSAWQWAPVTRTADILAYGVLNFFACSEVIGVSSLTTDLMVCA